MSTQTLAERHRPTSPADLAGAARGAAEGLLTVAQQQGQLCALLSGPSGSGKSTVAAILTDALAKSDMDVFRINAGDYTGVDFVRKIKGDLHLCSWADGWRVWIFEEAHNLSPNAQEALLDILEHYPLRRALVFTTTKPDAFTDAFLSRAFHVPLEEIERDDLVKLLWDIASAEGLSLGVEDAYRIALASDGNARAALTALQWYSVSGQLPGVEAA